MNSEDFVHRQRRISLYQSQHMNHGAISDLFQKEEEEALQKAEQQKRQVQESTIQQSINSELSQQQAEINEKKMDILNKTEEKINKISEVYQDSEKLANHLQTEYFDKIQPNSETSVFIVATRKSDGEWDFHVQTMPSSIDISKIKRIDIIKED